MGIFDKFFGKNAVEAHTYHFFLRLPESDESRLSDKNVQQEEPMKLRTTFE